uniref:Uncharacterized protein n=1 Tax=Glossina pallidipes TaxID=7398 RepID=A0A1A9ZAM3_GLOPL
MPRCLSVTKNSRPAYFCASKINGQGLMAQKQAFSSQRNTYMCCGVFGAKHFGNHNMLMNTSTLAGWLCFAIRDFIKFFHAVLADTLPYFLSFYYSPVQCKNILADCESDKVIKSIETCSAVARWNLGTVKD